jgi:hypothetical protein
LIIRMFGFSAARHSGGGSLHQYCRENRLNPKNLYIGWLKNCQCVRCDENKIYDLLQPPLNKRRPPKCNGH